MINHISFPCSNLKLSSAYYDAILSALGYEKVWATDTACGYGPKGSEDIFTIKSQQVISAPGPGFHVAFTATSRTAVDEFYKQALIHGGTDKGRPGLRLNYGPNYYAAFVLDPDGHHIEAVCHNEEL